MSFLVDLFRLDALLIRAVLFSVKASELADWVDYGHPGEILTAVSKRFTAFKRPSRFSSDPLVRCNSSIAYYNCLAKPTFLDRFSSEKRPIAGRSCV